MNFSPLAFSCSPWILFGCFCSPLTWFFYQLPPSTSPSLPPYTKPGIGGMIPWASLRPMPLWIRFRGSFNFNHLILIPTYLCSHSLLHLSFVSSLPLISCPPLHPLPFLLTPNQVLVEWYHGPVYDPRPFGSGFVVLSISIIDFDSHLPVLSFSPSSFLHFLPTPHLAFTDPLTTVSLTHPLLHWPLLWLSLFSSNTIYLSILPCWTLHPALDISFLFFFFCSERPLPLGALHYNSSRLFPVSPIHYFPLIFLPISSPICSPYMSIS
jgi:hypothetical protein